jgi:hypothetical protein
VLCIYVFIHYFYHRLSSRFGIILSSELTTLVYCRRVLGKSVKVDKLTQQVTIDIQWGETLHACPLNTIVEVSVCVTFMNQFKRMDYCVECFAFIGAEIIRLLLTFFLIVFNLRKHKLYKRLFHFTAIERVGQ